LSSRNHLGRSWTKSDTPPATIEADPASDGPADRPAIYSSYVGAAHVIDRAVVIKFPVPPISALVAVSIVTAAIVDTAVEADLRPPIAWVPNIQAVIPPPIARSP